jgi:fluoroacetyl-CoA thioesterase
VTSTDAAAAADTGKPRIAPGRAALLTHVVRPEDSATAWGNDLPVLATPVLLWLSEIAAMQAVDGAVAPGWMTVGTHHDSAHEAPTAVGATITVRATLTGVEGRTLHFDVEAHAGERRILSGRHRRGLVRTSSFRERYGL